MRMELLHHAMVKPNARHLSLAHTRGENESFWCAGRGHMAHAPNASAVRGLGSLTVLQLHVFAGMCMVLGLSTKKCAEARLDTQRCILANQRQQV
jgi:hypothetical protein